MNSFDSNEGNFCQNIEITIPERFPAVYGTRGDSIEVYLGVIRKDDSNMDIGCGLYWDKGKHSTDREIQEKIAGFYCLRNGIIYKDRFIDEPTFSSYSVIQKNEYVDLPNSVSSYYGICDCETHEENEADTHKAFGLTFDELDQILEAYGQIFNLGNIYERAPRITRSMQRSNCCDLSYAWIPKGFPYITFSSTGGPFSHVSLNAFYNHLKLLLLNKSKSIIWKQMIDLGIKEESLNHLLSLSDYCIRPVVYGEFSQF